MHKQEKNIISSIPLLSVTEEKAIEQKVTFELNEMQQKMIIIGGTANFIAGLMIIYTLFNQVDTKLLFGWYGALILTNILNISSALYYKLGNLPREKFNAWQRAYHILLGIISLIWGSVAVILAPTDTQYQLYLMVFLILALVSFAFGTITDFIAAATSIICMTVPFICFHFYINFLSTANNQAPNLGSQFALCITILALFLLVATYIGYRLIRKSFKLSFINASLSEKLATANQDLEQTNRSLDQKVKKRTEELENTLQLVTHQATHDLLTDLPNQRLLEQHMAEAIKQAKKNNSLFALAFLGLNRTKIINDSMGHQTGGLIIKAVADRLKHLQEQANLTSAYTRYTVTHAWGDVFVILLSPLNHENTTNILRSLFAILHEPFYLHDKPFSITASIGVCLYPQDGVDTKTLLMNAEAAMFRAKKYGGNKFEFYTADLNANTSKQLELESGLYNALAQNEFVLHYQPIVRIKTGEIVGMEVLTRWQHPTLGLIAPADFISIAEDIGLIVPIGEWVLKRACHQTKQWHNQGFSSLRIAVNLAAKQLAQESIIATIMNALKESNLPADALELEFTETAILDEKIIPIAKKLKAAGIHLAIDDFGTGYSGLTYVRQFSIDKLKIDKSFVQDIGRNKESETIILTIIDMAKKLGMLTLAEGVETEEQLLFLKEHDCELIQGFYFSRPVDPEGFTYLLSQKDWLESDKFAYLRK